MRGGGAYGEKSRGEGGAGEEKSKKEIHYRIYL
jgi:hypothetical protein